MVERFRKKKNILGDYLHRTLTVEFNDGEKYTGVLVPKDIDNNAYYLIYEEDDNDRVKFFFVHNAVKIWLHQNGKMIKIYELQRV